LPISPALARRAISGLTASAYWMKPPASVGGSSAADTLAPRTTDGRPLPIGPEEGQRMSGLDATLKRLVYEAIAPEAQREMS
jgi:hypothetical protein